ncbi:fimbrial protein [Variovorax sp. J22G73]|jgi:major type 1 subunit fimbrin (pilin)|uniref:fimbrial protein n=1 Tax=unclassified Variovorax TaxID=663243 RepID=UPI000D5E08C4|nr:MULTISPECIES: fimbrial protein [unclassified Variovorax]MDM0004058.1 fimbrial protein [Variovorax sp. J22R203]MDM0096276.1 fimbrial protein [Variovorax sp. J22G73]
MISKSRIFSILIAATAAQSAFAADGTINFAGEVKDQTCTVTVNGQVSPAVSTVTLPTVSSALLDTAGKTTGQTGFKIGLSACSGPATTASAFFESGATVDAITNNLRNTTGTARLVQLQLVDGANGNVIKAGDTSQVTATTATAITANSATLPYAVQYFATGKATAGTVLSSVTYSINYK